jgi:excisionase family DNA binding protein
MSPPKVKTCTSNRVGLPRHTEIQHRTFSDSKMAAGDTTVGSTPISSTKPHEILKILHYPVDFPPFFVTTLSTSPSEGEILTIKQVVDYLKVTERTIYRLAGAKKIPAFKVGGTWRFSRLDIDAWIKQQSTEGLDTGLDETP